MSVSKREQVVAFIDAETFKMNGRNPVVQQSA